MGIKKGGVWQKLKSNERKPATKGFCTESWNWRIKTHGLEAKRLSIAALKNHS